MGVTKNDIHYLSIPIELACKRYLIIDKINLIPDLVIIFRCAQEGLNNLMKTYNIYPIIVHCLKYYYSIIDTYLHLISCQQQTLVQSSTKPEYKTISNDISKPIKIPKSKNKERTSESSESYHTPILNIEYLNAEQKEEKPNQELNITDEDQNDEPPNENELLLLYTPELLNNFDTVWDKSKIKIVIDMIKYLLEEKSASEYAAYIETFMIPIDKEILKIIN
jgi:hypothetical protein